MPSARNAPKLCPATPPNVARCALGRSSRAESLADHATESRTDGSIAVRDRIGQLDQPGRVESRRSVLGKPGAELPAGGLAVGVPHVSGRAVGDRDQEWP